MFIIISNTYKFNYIKSNNNIENKLRFVAIMKKSNKQQNAMTKDNKLSNNLLEWMIRKDQLDNHNKQQDEKIIILSTGQGIFEKTLTKKKMEENRIHCKMIGLSSSSKNMAEFVEPPFLIDKYSCSYIVNNKILKTNQNISNTAGIQIHRNLKDDPVYLAFEYLVKEKKLFLVDGHKFGCSFLAYKEHPDSAHAVHLVFVNPENSQNQGEQISRLAGICKKTAMIVKTYTIEGQQVVHSQEVLPKSGQLKKISKQIQKTQQLLTLKKLIGYLN